MAVDELTRFIANDKERVPDQTSMNYVIELLKNDRDKFEPLIEISKLMSTADFEVRSLNNLKQLYS
jgi:hypothetical protein